MTRHNFLRFFIAVILFDISILFSKTPLPVYADFSQELRDQMAEIKGRHSQLNETYFHDMAIVVRKADDAEIKDLTSEMINSYLFKAMDDYVDKEIAAINEIFITDRFSAAKQLQELIEFRRQYEPSEEFLNTTNGQSFSGQMVRLRDEAAQALNAECQESSIKLGIKAIRKTGLFMTNSSAEISDMRELSKALECSLSWKKKVVYHREEEFESEYESGTFTEDATLMLKSNPREKSDARWEGEWKYHYKGREGELVGISQAILIYRRGDDTAKLTISVSRLFPTGRMNMPLSLAGEERTLEMEGTPVFPRTAMIGVDALPLIGCHDNAK